MHTQGSQRRCGRGSLCARGASVCRDRSARGPRTPARGAEALGQVVYEAMPARDGVRARREQALSE